MIGFLRGNIFSLKPGKLILDVNGVGYNVLITITTYENLSDKSNAEIFIYTSVKEDSITLYGFLTEKEKNMFELLISVNGIGPKSAIGILSGIEVDELKYAIANSDFNRISKAPGIGKKMAERLVIELKNKVDSVYDSVLSGSFSNARGEAVAALTALGYNLKNSEKIIREILSSNPDLTTEDLIKKALNEFSK